MTTPSRDARNDAGAAQADNAAYWDANLDVGNIERETAPIDYPEERRFFLAPEGAAAVAALQPLAGKRVVDVGAGLGVATMIFAEAGATVEAVDLAPRRLERVRALAEARGLAERVHCHEAAAERLPFDDASVDTVFTKAVLLHTDLAAAAREARRVLRPGGRVVFLETLDGNPLANLYRRLLAPKAWQGITRYFNDERVAIVREVFPDLRERRFHLIGFGAFVFQFAVRWPGVFRAVVAVTNALDNTLLALCPPLRRWAWFTLMTATKPGPRSGAE